MKTFLKNRVQRRGMLARHASEVKAKVASDVEMDAINVALLTCFPLVGGFRFGLFMLPPDGAMPATPVDMEAALRVLFVEHDIVLRKFALRVGFDT